MILYPEIALKHGRCVSGGLGRRGPRAILHDDPLTLALGYVESGAEWLHLVDLDAAAGEGTDNLALIRRIVAASSAPVQVAGGIHSLGAVARWIDWGARGVVLGDRFAPGTAFVAECAERHPFAIVVRAEMRGGRVAMACENGPPVTLSALRYARALDHEDLAALILADADPAPRRSGWVAARLAAVARNLATPVIAEPGDGARAMLEDLQATGCLAGAVTGAALHRGEMTLGEAQGALGARPYATARVGAPDMALRAAQ